jgi:hypothetical protein
VYGRHEVDTEDEGCKAVYEEAGGAGIQDLLGAVDGMDDDDDDDDDDGGGG